MESMEKRFNLCNIPAVLYVIIFLSSAVIHSNTVDPDFWARLLQGDAFLNLGEVLRHDPFSYTETHVWLDHEWGSGVIFAFILNHFGFKGILLLRLIIPLFIYFFIYKAVKLQNKQPDKLIFLVYFVFSAFALQNIVWSGLRCHFFTFLFFTIFIYILEIVRKNSVYGLLAVLPLLMLLWANCHGGCVAGLGVILIYALDGIFCKKRFKYYFIALAFCFLAMFINPYGMDYVKFIFTASTMQRPMITEWISPFFHSDIKFMLSFKILYLINLILLASGIKNIKKQTAEYMLLIICAYLSFRYVKDTPFFIISSMIFLYPHKIRVNKLIGRITLIFALIITGVFVQYFGNNYFLLEAVPYKEAEFIKINNLKGKIIAPMDMGSYLAYKLYPDNLIYMDGRYEEVYFSRTKELLDRFYNVQKGWEKIFAGSLKPDYIIIPSDALINDYMPEAYKAVYQTRNNVIYVSISKLKSKYYLPSDDLSHYLEHAFERNFKFVVQ